jgi:hypothetical protein
VRHNARKALSSAMLRLDFSCPEELVARRYPVSFGAGAQTFTISGAREQLKVIETQKALETGRLEKRFAVAIPVRITSLDRLWLNEKGTTENVSFFGARILVKHMWRSGEEIIVESPTASCAYHATIRYCQHLEGWTIAIGVRLAGEAMRTTREWSDEVSSRLKIL